MVHEVGYPKELDMARSDMRGYTVLYFSIHTINKQAEWSCKYKTYNQKVFEKCNIFFNF